MSLLVSVPVACQCGAHALARGTEHPCSANGARRTALTPRLLRDTSSRCNTKTISISHRHEASEAPVCHCLGKKTRHERSSSCLRTLGMHGQNPQDQLQLDHDTSGWPVVDFVLSVFNQPCIQLDDLVGELVSGIPEVKRSVHSSASAAPESEPPATQSFQRSNQQTLQGPSKVSCLCCGRVDCSCSLLTPAKRVLLIAEPLASTVSL